MALTDSTEPSGRLLYTPVQAAQALSISRSSLYVLLAEGVITSVRIGSSRRIPASALAAFVDRLAEESADSTDR
jgi:excisionase family DNA binding protein